MNRLRPHLSVIMATYNQDRFIEEAIKSILDQDFDDVEIIVVNDGSTDRTSEMVSQFDDVILIQQQNRGQGAAVNVGIAHARGKLVGFLDSDDLMAPNTLAMRVARFEEDLELELSQGLVVEFMNSGPRVLGRPVPGLLPGTALVRRNVLDRVGMMRTDVKLGVFMDWLMRARDMNVRMYQHQEVLLIRRLHDDNLGIRESDSRGDYVRILKLALNRRRKSGQLNAGD